MKISRGTGDKDGNMPGERYGCRCGIEWLDSGEEMTPNEKAETIRINFVQDSYLPPLNQEQLKIMGSKSKPVVFKQHTAQRNLSVHSEISKKEYPGLIGEALYKPLIRPLQDNKNKNYWHFIGVAKDDKRAVVLLDIEERKQNFEIVHILKLRRQSVKGLLRKLGFKK